MKHLVSIVKVPDPHDDGAVRQAILSSIDLLGGMSSFVKSGEKVVLKPNLEAPRHSRTAATTSMVFVERLIELTRRAGGDPIVAEGPFMNYDTKAVFKITGVDEVCKRLGVDLVDLNDTETIMVEVPRGKAHKRLRIPRIVMEADRLINLPKLKTHHLTTLTCAMKNLKGILPGMDKQLSHVRGLHQAIVDINKIVESDLVIVDGVTAMEGMGPTFGDAFPLGLVIAGTNNLAVDTVCARIMGLEPDDVEHLKIACHDFSVKPDDVEIVGVPLSEVRAARIIPREKWTYTLAVQSAHFLDRYVYQAFRPGKSFFPVLSGLFGAHPRIDVSICSGCGVCVKACPVNAIDLPAKKIRGDKCIDCLICSEICPVKAVCVKGIKSPHDD